MTYKVKATQEKMLELASNWIPPEEKRVIEIGCNNGNFSELLEKRHVANYIGIDIQDDKIKEARKLHPKYKFYCADITKNLYFLTKASMIVSFQYFANIKEDLVVLNNIIPGTKMILSVPNSSYGDRVRWFELRGWSKRFSVFMDFNKIVIIQNPRKPDKRSFLFRGTRNDYVNKKTIVNFEDLTFDNMMFRRNL
jgi:SAM-dependent methyltransferase